MGRQMYFYYLEWLFVYNQNNIGYLQITTLQNRLSHFIFVRFILLVIT